MEISTVLMLLAAMLYAASFVQVAPTFVPPAVSPESLPAAPESRLGNEWLVRDPSEPIVWGATFRNLAAIAATGAAACAIARSRAQARVQLKVARSPIEVYATSLFEAATRLKESVPVAEDMLQVKKLYGDGDWIEAKLADLSNAYWLTDLQKAEELIGMFGLSSSIAPKFITYLAKKKRLNILSEIAVFYVKELFVSQMIAPVRVRTAKPLSPEQINEIKTKMKEKTGCKHIKLVVELSPELLAGFVVEYGFVDPEAMSVATQEIDLSLKAQLNKAAINKGVVSQV